MLITQEQIKKLDALFQEILLGEHKHRSWLGGVADVVHHFKHKGSGNYSLRWYVPNGIPLNHTQHDLIHGNNGKEIEDLIVKIKGEKWEKDLEKQKNKLAKYAKYEDVVAHIKGLKNNYC